MRHYQHRLAHFWLVVFTAGIVALTLWPVLVQAGSPLPPRDPPPATRSAAKDHGSDRGKPLGAYIELQTPMAAASAWSVVQWQDSAGSWHEVEGWRGSLPGSNRWWVHPKDFGKGLFRWVITQGPNGSLLGVSAPFNLPTQANQIVWVQVSP